MKSYQNNRTVRKFFSCTKCKEYDAKLVNPFVNHIYCSKCGSLLSEIPEVKYKKMKKKLSQNLENRNEEDNKIPYKLKGTALKNKYNNNEKTEDKKIKKQKKEKILNKNNNSHNNNYNRQQSSSHYSNMNMNFYNDNDNARNYNNINRININNPNPNNINSFNNNFDYYNNQEYNNDYNRPQNKHHKNNSRRGRSVNNPQIHIHSNNNNPNNPNNFFSDFFSDSDFAPFSSDFDFPNFSPFRITIHRQPVSNDIFDPMFSSFGSFFNGFFQDNFSSNFRSNIAGDFFSQILSILERNQAEANKNKHPPASENALKKLKKFSMNEKYCKKDGKGKIELPNCCICLTEIQKGEKTVLLPCGHMFHWKCCLTWLKKNNTCPMCRFEIK